MRLTEAQRLAIRESVREVLPEADIYVFGSRLDDTKRGGDIDLLLLIDQDPNTRTKAQLLKGLWKRIGEQKIDLVLEKRGKLSSFANLVMLDAQLV